MTPEFLKAQLDAVFTDIFPDAVKIGMVSNGELILAIGETLKEYQARHIVVDPVMVATSGAALLEPDAVKILKEKLLPLAEVITPNIPEAQILWGRGTTLQRRWNRPAKWRSVRHMAAMFFAKEDIV